MSEELRWSRNAHVCHKCPKDGRGDKSRGCPKWWSIETAEPGKPVVTRWDCADVLLPIALEQIKMVANRPAAEIGALRGELENRAERMEEGLAGATTMIAMEVGRLRLGSSTGPLRLEPPGAQRLIGEDRSEY